MTDTTTLAPNYKQLMELHGQGINAIDPVSFARAVLAKWGAPAPASGEPMFWVRLRSDGGYEGPIHNDNIEDVRRRSGAWTPLFAAPPAQEARVPLSDDQIDEIHLANSDAYERGEVEYESHGFARAVEAAHGIGITAAQKPQAPDLIAAAEAIYALRNLDSHDLPCIEAWPDEFAALGRAITAQKETP